MNSSNHLLSRPKLRMTNFHGLLTVSPQMFDFFEVAARVARSDSTVLVRGETGTGKELVAKLFHKLGPRSGRTFRAINCATLTPELLASELFGHVRGAFTGAIKDRRGLFELAHEGTVFLDEVAEIPVAIQARLLRVLQERTFVPVGGTQAKRVDVRVVSATHRAIREEVASGRFRSDLMYRLRVVPIFLPRLADREGDVEALTWHFINEFNQAGNRTIDYLERDVMDALLAYDWPGNIRELRNSVEYAFAVGDGPIFSTDELLPELRGIPATTRRAPQTERELERDELLEALRQAHHKRGKAADLLNISRSTLWRKLREHGIT